MYESVCAGREIGLKAAGLGARDTLRLEAGMPLYGHELSETINPYQAGLGFAVNLQGRSFVGADALRRLKEDPNQPKRIGLELAGRRVPRENFPVAAGGQPVGMVSSGTFSPTLDKPIAMAYVRPEAAAQGVELAVDIRGRLEPAESSSCRSIVEVSRKGNAEIRNTVVKPEELLFSETHEWVRIEDEGGVKVATGRHLGVRRGTADGPGVHGIAAGREASRVG